MSANLYKYIIVVVLTAVLAVATNASAGGLSPNLQQAAAHLKTNQVADSLVSVVVFLEDQTAREAVFQTAQSIMLTRSQRVKTVMSQLKSFAPSYRNNVETFLNNKSSHPVVKHWIVPAYTATLPISAITVLAQMDGVKLVVENARLSFELPVEISASTEVAVATISDQLNLLKVPELWKRGLKGRGRLVCSFDTGVEQSHPALAGKWRGNHTALAESWFSPVAPDTLPYDKIGHGTHTMGIMVGAVEADTFGVAPEAEWITAGVIDQGRTLSLTISDILQAFQWALNPDDDESTTDDVPDVILNSWGIPRGLFVPCDETFWGALDNVEAAGIVTIFAAGNEGPDPQTLRNPADRASTPLSAFAVGAVDNAKVIGSFSSRGPSSCDNSQIKPEVVAPGVNVRSSYKGGTYYYMTGTSMAAPYIAGLVALVRQYNPDASVEQIKYAFLKATQDLGPTGEDNAYGNGLVDASQILNYIPLTSGADFALANYQVSGDGIAAPGEACGVQIWLTNSTANLETVSGTLLALDKLGIVVNNQTAEFYFGTGGTTAVNSVPFEIALDSSLYHGQQLTFALALEAAEQSCFDTVVFALTVGIEPDGIIATQSNSRLSLGVSDFGQYGFAPSSIYNVLGDGFRFDGTNNLLYEAGLVVGRSNLQMARSIRNEEGFLAPSDFVPVQSLTEAWLGEEGDWHRTALFNDSRASVPIPIEIRQETITFEDPTDDGLILFKFSLRNTTLEKLSGLYFGFLCDFDMSAADSIGYVEPLQMIYQKNADGLYVGLVGLDNISGLQPIINVDGKVGFSNDQLINLMANPQTDISGLSAGDLMILASSASLSVGALQSVKVAFALVVGQDLNELQENAVQAQQAFDLMTDVGDDPSMLLPEQLTLYQNYPNPFNPTTYISFSLTEATNVTLDIINLLGQKVTTLQAGVLPAGTHGFEWNATDESGHSVASGVYFYRLKAGDKTLSRKMLLLK